MPTWDDWIDETARRLTEGQLQAAFTSRVLAQLGDQPRARSRRWWLVPAAATAIAIIGLLIPWERHEDVRRTPDSTVRSTSSFAPPAAVNSTATEPDNTRPSLPVGRGAQRAVIAAETIAAAPPPSDLDVESIAIVPLDLPPATFAAIEDVSPLAIDSIAIEPLTAGQ